MLYNHHSYLVDEVDPFNHKLVFFHFYFHSCKTVTMITDNANIMVQLILLRSNNPLLYSQISLGIPIGLRDYMNCKSRKYILVSTLYTSISVYDTYDFDLFICIQSYLWEYGLYTLPLSLIMTSFHLLRFSILSNSFFQVYDFSCTSTGAANIIVYLISFYRYLREKIFHRSFYL